MHAREIAFFALLEHSQRGIYVWDTLESWKKRRNPEKRELDFAYELACGSVRMLLYLEYRAKKIAQKLPKKPKERMLFYLGLYQRLFLRNIPVYAVVDTSVELAKKHGMKQFGHFLNAVLRKDFEEESELEISLKSYPQFFVDALHQQYGEKAIELLRVMNLPSKLMATTFHDGIQNQVYETAPAMSYIQNCTPVYLVKALADRTPHRILDFCAAPGGKSILLSHMYPKAKLFVHDLPPKMALLQENLSRFSIQANILGDEKEFDLIVVDAPCSNSGVLYKCPEARLRLSQQSLNELEEIQFALLKQASRLCKDGTIWYMTCSILKQENEDFCEEAAKELGLKIVSSHLILPDANGQHGGFGCSFCKINY